jgi:hypothetical protein
MTTNPHHAKRWTTRVILAIAQLIVVLDATIVDIAGALFERGTKALELEPAAQAAMAD